MTGLFAGIRAFHFASLMAIWGASLYLVLLKRAQGMGIPANLTRIAVAIAAALALATAILWLGLVAGQMSGDWGAAYDPGTIWTVAVHTRFGHIWLARIGGLVLLWLVALAMRRSPLTLVACLAALLLGSLGLISHAPAASGDFALGRALGDAIHLLTAGFWLGSLLVLAVLAWLRRRAPEELFAPFRLFSLWGVYAVALLVVTGLINAASILPVHSISFKSAYADMLGSKIVIALVMIALAICNRSQLLPALRNGEKGAVRSLARNVVAEIALAFLVIAIVGYLGLMPPA
jgi:putative copper resistance protein D